MTFRLNITLRDRSWSHTLRNWVNLQWKKSPCVEIGETSRRTTITAALLSSLKDTKATWSLQKRTERNLRLWEARFSGLVILRLNCFASNQEPLITCVGVFQWDREYYQGSGKAERTKVQRYLLKTWSRVLRTSDWAKGSHSTRAITLNTKLRQRRSGLEMTLWMSLRGPGRAQPWLEPYRSISAEIWKWLSTVSPHLTWHSLRRSAEKNVRKSEIQVCKLKAITSTKGASTKY